MAYPLGDARMGLREYVSDARRLSVLLDGTQRRIDHRHRDIAVVRGKLVRLAGAAALGKHLELGAEHVAFRDRELLAPGVAVLAALDVKRGRLVQLGRGIPGAEVDLEMHEPLRAEYAHGEN